MPAASNRRARLSAAAAAMLARSQRLQVQVQGGGVGGGEGLQVADHAGQPQHLIAQRRQLSGVGSVTPSSSASCPACSTATGVRSSWATSATRSRRICSCRSSLSAIWSKAVASSRSSPGARIGPTRAARSPLAMALVTAISRATGRVIRRATTRPVTSASSAASPAAPAMARSSADCSTWSGGAEAGTGEPDHGLADRAARAPPPGR